MRGGPRLFAPLALAVLPALPAFAAPPGPPGLLEVAWRYEAGAPVQDGPATDGERIYLLTATGELHAVDLRGRRAWSRSFPLPGPAGQGGREEFRAPPLAAGGLVLAGSRSGTLYAVDAATGKERWRYAVGGEIRSEAVPLGPSAVLVVSQPDGVLHRVELATGKAAWVSPPTNRCDAPAAAEGDRVVYGNCDAALHLFSAVNGDRLAVIPLGKDGEVSAGAVMAEGRAFAGDRSGRLYGAEAAPGRDGTGGGRIAWADRRARGAVTRRPAVAGDRVVFVADDGSVLALDRRDGRELWQASVEGRPLSPVVRGEDLLVAADGRLLVIALRDGAVLRRFELSDRITSPVVADGLILVGTDEGRLVALREGGGKR